MTAMTTYIKSAERREQILEAACKLAEATHYNQIRRHHLVDVCGTAAGNVSRVMGSMDELREAVIKYALKHNRLSVVAQAIMDKHPAVEHLDNITRCNALMSVA